MGRISDDDVQVILNRAHELASAADVDEDALWDAIRALHWRPEQVVFDKCAEWSPSPQPFERSLAADILGQLGCGDGQRYPYRERSIPILAGLLGDLDPRVLQSALTALGHLGSRECADAVRRLAGHPDSDVRYAAVMALLGDESAESIDVLIALSCDEVVDVRDWATFGLGTQVDVDTPDLREALWARVSDSDAETRGEAFVGLARRGDRRVLEPLRSVLVGGEAGCLDVEAARHLGSPELVPALESLRTWWELDPVMLDEAITACRSAGEDS